MDVFEAIDSRRTIRTYRQEPIPGELMERLVQVIRRSPTASNAQELRLVAVQDPRRLRAVRRFAPGLSGRPAAILVLAVDMDIAEARGGADGRETACYVNTGLALGYLLLAAHALGLGACPVRSFYEDAVRVILKMPARVKPVVLLSLGYPAAPPRPRQARPLDLLVHREEYVEPAS